MGDSRLLPRPSRQVQVRFGGRVDAVTVDLHRHGFCAEMPGVFLPGSEVHGTLGLEEGEVPFRGRVVWARPGDPRACTRSRFGIRFTAIGP